MKKAKIIKTFLAFITMLSTLFLFNQPVNAANKEVETGSVMKKIKQSKELVVGTSADYPPLEFTTSEMAIPNMWGLISSWQKILPRIYMQS